MNLPKPAQRGEHKSVFPVFFETKFAIVLIATPLYFL